MISEWPLSNALLRPANLGTCSNHGEHYSIVKTESATSAPNRKAKTIQRLASATIVSMRLSVSLLKSNVGQTKYKRFNRWPFMGIVGKIHRKGRVL